MYSVMIADDEEIERKAFRLFLSKNFPDIVILEDVVNGIELIENVARLQPDIIIVDINMPGLNGLDAVKLLRQKQCTSKIIIHTAYSYFQYAQEALCLGADDYLLKPVKKEKIVSTLEKCISKIEDERKTENEHLRLKKMINEISPIIETDFMSSIILGEIREENLRVYLNILEMDFHAGYVMTIYLPDDQISRVQTDELEKSALKKDILNFVKTDLRNVCKCIISPVISNKISIFISTEGEITQYRAKIWSIEIGELITEKIEKSFSIKVYAGIGQLYKNLEQLPKSYKESISSLNDKSVNSNVKHYGDLFNEREVENPFITFEDEVLKFIVVYDLQSCNEIIDKIFAEIEKTDGDDDSTKEMALGFVAVLNRALMGNSLSNNHGFGSIKVAFKEVMDINSRTDLRVWLKNAVQSIIDILKQERKAKVSGFVRNAVDYVNENYMQDISLENVAEKTGVSFYYLSRLFKQELGINFIDYLTEVRLKHALRLIREKDYPIKELSEKVGYANPTYFCKVFKKYTGKTIGEFKEYEKE